MRYFENLIFFHRAAVPVKMHPIFLKNEFIDDLQTKTRPVAVSFSNVVYFERMDNGNITRYPITGLPPPSYSSAFFEFLKNKKIFI